uniref:Ethylene-responsive transcription factor 3-like n=1 Tax=Elaeis guineensis var. tenera TaxID=51953 RepID=A0A8N4ER52_ELAGV|nr:ethylene-responsive transcription factor 3-like [Elaeis guineensis]
MRKERAGTALAVVEAAIRSRSSSELGTFDFVEEIARAYDASAISLHGWKVKTNFSTPCPPFPAIPLPNSSSPTIVATASFPHTPYPHQHQPQPQWLASSSIVESFSGPQCSSIAPLRSQLKSQKVDPPRILSDEEDLHSDYDSSSSVVNDDLGDITFVYYHPPLPFDLNLISLPDDHDPVNRWCSSTRQAESQREGQGEVASVEASGEVARIEQGAVLSVSTSIVAAVPEPAQ